MSTSGPAAPPAVSPQRDEPQSAGWALVVGVILALATIKELVRRFREQPAVVRASHPQRGDKVFGVALVVRTLEWLGEFVLRARPGL